MSNKNWALPMEFSTVITSVRFVFTVSLLMSAKELYIWKIFHVYCSDGFLSFMHSLMVNKVEFFLKTFPHWLYQYGFSSVWIFLCSNTVVIPENFTAFIIYKGLSPTTYSVTVSKEPSEHRLSPSLYSSKGFWLVWFLQWLNRTEFFLKLSAFIAFIGFLSCSEFPND